MRCALTLAYNGSGFLGSQRQKSSKNTVMGELEHILKRLNIRSAAVASGRTDRGVHASAQVCHIDLPPFWSDIEKLKKVLNEMLPASIKVKNIRSVANDFHARYGAKRRVYRYVIKEGPSNPFEESFITFLENVPYEKIQKNIELFRGEHDFKNFMKSGSNTKSTKRIIYKAFAYRYKGFIILNFEANGFLRTQIRLMVGSLLHLDAEKIREQLQCTQKYKMKPAPSNGLYLAKIKY